mmetsp:Transcript_27172/g.69173  ORF Transcript_27172/g.69173 Transcript_27172/m.69173 type:complete len:202 (+) Transcript_27172:1639-2244(+)
MLRSAALLLVLLPQLAVSVSVAPDTDTDTDPPASCSTGSRPCDARAAALPGAPAALPSGLSPGSECRAAWWLALPPPPPPAGCCTDAGVDRGLWCSVAGAVCASDGDWQVAGSNPWMDCDLCLGCRLMTRLLLPLLVLTPPVLTHVDPPLPVPDVLRAPLMRLGTIEASLSRYLSRSAWCAVLLLHVLLRAGGATATGCTV